METFFHMVNKILELNKWYLHSLTYLAIFIALVAKNKQVSFTSSPRLYFKDLQPAELTTSKHDLQGRIATAYKVICSFLKKVLEIK